jgi:hypothetical protein
MGLGAVAEAYVNIDKTKACPDGQTLVFVFYHQNEHDSELFFVNLV